MGLSRASCAFLTLLTCVFVVRPCSADLLDAMINKAPSMQHIRHIIDSFSGRLDEFEREQIDDRLIRFQEHFDDAAREIISSEDNVHDKLARAEHSLQEIVEEVRARAANAFPMWIIPTVAVSAVLVGMVALRCMTHRVVKRANSEPVLGGFSPVSSKAKKAW